MSTEYVSFVLLSKSFIIFSLLSLSELPNDWLTLSTISISAFSGGRLLRLSVQMSSALLAGHAAGWWPKDIARQVYLAMDSG